MNEEAIRAKLGAAAKKWGEARQAGARLEQEFGPKFYWPESQEPPPPHPGVTLQSWEDYLEKRDELRSKEDAALEEMRDLRIASGP